MSRTLVTKKSDSRKKVAIIGMGYVGLPLALLADRKGYRVTGIDTNRGKIRALVEHRSPIKDPAIESDLRTTGVTFTNDYRAVADAEIIVVCVPTPVYENHTPDLEPVIEAARGIGFSLRPGHLVILESTVNPGVSEEVVLPILEDASGLIGGGDFFLAHCPERINPGDAAWHVGNIPRVVGALEEKGLLRTLDFYRSIVDAEITPMRSLKEAEAVKIVENAFRDINIAFVNELAMSFSRLGIDVMHVIKGASTKPFGFMPHYPSCGVGGHCIPVDPYYLIEYAEKNGFHHDFLALARTINNRMPEFTVQELIAALNEKHLALKDLPVALLGISYKANIDDCRESPSFEIQKHLERQGAIVRTFDPHVPNRSTVPTLQKALRGAKAAVIATAHNEFKTLSPQRFLTRHVEVVVDGCNCLPKERFETSGIVYKGIGR